MVLIRLLWIVIKILTPAFGLGGSNIRLQRCLSSERFNTLLKSICEIENKKPDEVMYKDKHDEVYVTLVLAL